MNYLLINHIAAHAGSSADHIKLPAAWARDLGAAARAAETTGIRLIVATPLSPSIAPADVIDVVPADAGFEHIALPHYESARGFLQQRANLAARLKTAMSAADVVQLDVGGHPMPLGLFADDIARSSAKPTLWMLAGDELPELHPGGGSASAAKRIVGRTLGHRMQRLLAEALRNAAAVITTHADTTKELVLRHGVEATMIESVDVADAELADAHEISTRHHRLLDTSRPLRLLMPAELTIDSGTEHILAAMHRCWRLRVPVTLVANSRGGEAEAVQRHARELGLQDAVTLRESPSLADADVVVDSALSNASRLDHEQFIARGIPVVAYAPRRTSPGVMAITRGAVDLLADAVFQIGTNRAQLAGQMINGHAWVSERTVDAAHRRRFSMATALVPHVAPRGGLMKLLIVIVNFSTAALVVDCLRSIEADVRSIGGCRVCVVDCKSPDDSVPQLQSAITANGWADWCDFRPLDRNGGFAFGNNEGIRPYLSSNDPPELVLLLNPDTLSRPGAIPTLVQYMDAHPEVGIAGSRTEFPDGTPQTSAFRFPSIGGELEGAMRLGIVSRLLKNKIVAPPPADHEVPADWVVGASMMIRRAVFEKVGLMDDAYFMYFEEVDFCLRAKRAGFACRYVPQSRIVHLIGKASGVTDKATQNRRRPAYWFDSRRRYFVHNHGLLYAALADAAFAIGFCFWRVRRAIQRKPDPDPAHFLGDFLRHSVFAKGRA